MTYANSNRDHVGPFAHAAKCSEYPGPVMKAEHQFRVGMAGQCEGYLRAKIVEEVFVKLRVGQITEARAGADGRPEYVVPRKSIEAQIDCRPTVPAVVISVPNAKADLAFEREMLIEPGDLPRYGRTCEPAFPIVATPRISKEIHQTRILSRRGALKEGKSPEGLSGHRTRSEKNQIVGAMGRPSPDKKGHLKELVDFENPEQAPGRLSTSSCKTLTRLHSQPPISRASSKCSLIEKTSRLRRDCTHVGSQTRRGHHRAELC